MDLSELSKFHIMGNFAEHVLFGGCLATLFFIITSNWLEFSYFEIVTGFLIVFLASVFPDIDNKNSYVFRSVKSFISLLISILVFIAVQEPVEIRFFYSAVSFLSILALFKLVPIKHRGITHSSALNIIISGIIMVAGYVLIESIVPGLAAFIGLFSHLLLDGEIDFSL